MNLREKVIVDGIPYIWSTNLDDDGIREFFDLYADRIRESEPPKERPEENSRERKIVFQIKCRLAFLDFRDGVCFWSASDEKHHVLYRSNHEWELWNARQQEIEELRQEQEAEQAIERGLLKVEDHHLTEKANAAIKTGEYDIAAAYVSARMDLRLSSKGIQGLSYLWSRPSQLWWIFTQFPTSNYGIEFICKYDSKPQIFRNFAHWFAACRGLPTEERAEQTKLIYEKGMKLFPDSASLAKAACLFWRRMRRYDLAMQICSEAIKKGMKDGTKSGFEGRMKRLEKESQQIQPQRQTMNWFDRAKAEIETFFGKQVFSEVKLRQRDLAAIDAFHDLFMRLMNELKIRDTWPEKDRQCQMFLRSTGTVERSAKMGIRFTMGVSVDGWFIEAPIACEKHIRHMKDDYWVYITKLASIGKAGLISSYPPEWYSSPAIKRLIQHEGSLVFSIVRDFTLLASTSEHNFGVGNIEVTIPRESDEATVIQFFRDGLEALYRSNYLLHRSDYLEQKRKSKKFRFNDLEKR
jgi:hypothetical protein